MGQWRPQTDRGYALTTTGVELAEGKRYWEVELLLGSSSIYIGISSPNFDPKGEYFGQNCTDGWFVGGIYGLRQRQVRQRCVLLDLDNDSLR